MLRWKCCSYDILVDLIVVKNGNLFYWTFLEDEGKDEAAAMEWMSASVSTATRTVAI